MTDKVEETIDMICDKLKAKINRDGLSTSDAPLIEALAHLVNAETQYKNGRRES